MLRNQTRPNLLGLVMLLGFGLVVSLPTQTSAQTLYWNTNGSSATFTNANWGTGTAGPFTTAWTSGRDAVFSAASASTFATTTVGNVTVNANTTIGSGGTLTAKAGGSTVTVADGVTLTWTGQSWSTVSGAAIFTKAGNGTWNIGAQGNATAGSSFTLNAGTVIVSGNNAFGGANSPLTINSGTINSSGTRDYANGITVGGDFGLLGTGNATFSGTVALGASTRQIRNDTTSGSRIFSGVISGGNGAGLTFTGTGAGQAYLGGANTFTGTVSILGSEVGFASDGALGNTANTIVVDGGRFTASNTSGNAVSFTLTSGRGIQVGSSAGTSISVAGATGTMTYNGVISDKSGSTGAWVKQGAGLLVLGGTSNYSGATTISNGTIRLTAGNNRLPTTTVLSLGQAASANVGTFDLGGVNQTVAGLASIVGTNASASVTNLVTTSTGTSTLTLNVASGTYTYGDGTAANSGGVTGSVGITKKGAGTQIFGGSNSYTGSTTIDGGLLKVNGSIASSAVTINSTGILGGSGTTGAVSVNSGATISPGNSPGTLTAGNVTFAGGGNYNWQLFDSNGSAGTGWDLISSSGSLTISATSGNTFNLNLWTLSGTGPDVNGNALNFNAAQNKTWTIGTFSGGISGTSTGWYTINTGSYNGCLLYTSPSPRD